MGRIKIKIKHSRLPIVAEAILQYADLCTLQLSIKNNREDDFKIRLSIAMELFFLIQKKSLARHPPEISKVALELYQAIVLQSALLQFISNTANDFERNAIEIIKNALNLEIVNLSKTVNP